MIPTAPGIYRLTSPTFSGFQFEVEVYLSKKGHLRARILWAKGFRGGDFQGKRIETFSKEFVWSAT